MDKLKTKEISVNVSKKVGLPNYSSVMLSASATVEIEGEDASKAFKHAWKICWDEIKEQENEMSTKLETPDPIMEATKDVDVADTAVCPIHNVKLTHFEKDGEEWWGHKLENGKWCNGRNTRYNKELDSEI